MKKYLLKVVALISVAMLGTVPAIFGQLAQNPGDLTLHLIGNAHIDLAYRWRWNETTDRVIPDTFEGVLRVMQMEPKLTFSQSQMVFYENLQSTHPELFAAIKQKITEGTWSVVGGQWTEPDAILTSGESLIRQFLIAKEYTDKNLKIPATRIAWVPDSFCGQALTLPQIYAGCGIEFYVFGRGAPGDNRVFWWEGPDGSRLLAYKIPQHYNLKINEQLKTIATEWSALAGVKDVMILYGEGDHGGGPREPDLEAIRHFQQQKDFPKLVFDTPEKYLAKLSQSRSDWSVYRGEMGIGTGESGVVSGSWRGSFTSQARTKKANRDMENLLLIAEKFATIGSMLQRKPLFPRVDFREAWKLVLKNQFHDILPGTSIGDVFDDAMADYRLAKDEGERLLRFGLEVIGSRIDTRGDGVPFAVYNPHSWPRTDVVQVAIQFVLQPETFVIFDSNGKNIPFQIGGWSEDGLTAYIDLLAQDVPPLGYRLYRVIRNKTGAVATDLQMGLDFITNAFFKVKWDNQGVTSIFDKQLQTELLDGPGNRLQLLEESRSSSWDLMLSGNEIPVTSVAKPEVIEQGPVRIALLWQDRTESSFVRREMILKAGVPRLEFRMAVEWRDHDKILKVAFPVTVKNGRAVFEQPYGTIERPTDGSEWPAQNWIDLAGNSFGVALLNNGKYGFDVNGNLLRMSVVRGARDMDPRMDEGIHAFDYAIYSHKGDWRDGDVTQAALELNQPMIALQENLHHGTLPAWGGSGSLPAFPAEHSFFRIDCNHVTLSALKVQQGDWSPSNVVLRIFETEGRADRVVVNCPAKPAKVLETNHLEEPLSTQRDWLIQENGFAFEIESHQIRTFMVTF